MPDYSLLQSAVGAAGGGGFQQAAAGMGGMGGGGMGGMRGGGTPPLDHAALSQVSLAGFGLGGLGNGEQAEWGESGGLWQQRVVGIEKGEDEVQRFGVSCSLGHHSSIAVTRAGGGMGDRRGRAAWEYVRRSAAAFVSHVACTRRHASPGGGALSTAWHPLKPPLLPCPSLHPQA